MRVVALVDDLMDRSRLSAAVPEALFSEVVDGADVIVVDLSRHAGDVATIRSAAPGASIVAFGSHVDDEVLAAAREAGADVVMARSRFFRNPRAAVFGPEASPPPR